MGGFFEPFIQPKHFKNERFQAIWKINMIAFSVIKKISLKQYLNIVIKTRNLIFALI